MIERIKNSVPLKECMSRYGVHIDSRNKCCCPFHKEKTPSFSIKDDKFKCFGCGAGGDVFDFVSLYCNISFYEAVRRVDYDFGLNLLNKTLTRHERRVLREEERRRKANKVIEQKETERKQSMYDKMCREYRAALNYINNFPLRKKEPDTQWIKAYNTVQYSEEWFNHHGV